MGSGQEDHQEDNPQGDDYKDQAPTEGSAPRRPHHRKGDTAKMVAVLAHGGSQKEAAEAAGISVREVRRREREPDVQRMLRAARREQVRHWMAKIADAGPKALDTLLELLAEDHPADTRFKAAKEVVRAAQHNLDSLAAREELDEMQAQIDALEGP
jgi:hypothetical protein